jgi:hypothetical protein
MSKTILVVHGDKGGVGKSTYATLAADWLLRQFGAVAVVEGDETIFDVAPRFDGRTGATCLAVDLARPDASEDAIVALLSEIERAGGDSHIVINTPASASKTLDAQADIIAPAIADMGYQLLVAWMVDVGEDSAVLSASSKLCALAHHKIAVRNERLKPKEKLPWEVHTARQAWAASGGLEGSIPGLTERVAARIRDLKNAPFSAMIEDPEHLTIIERQAIKRWVNTAWTCGVEPLYRAVMGVDHG